jgi:flagellar FliL protein
MMAASALKEVRADPKGQVKQTQRQDPRAKPQDISPTEDGASRPKKRTWLKILLLAVLLLGGAGAAAWYFTLGEQPSAPARPGAKAAAKSTVPAKPPAFLPLEPFTVNLQHDNDALYLQVGLTLKLADAAITEPIKLRMPEIRNRILLLLSSKRASEISTLEGKQALSADIQREVLQSLGGAVPPQGVNGVLFTSFLIQ